MCSVGLIEFQFFDDFQKIEKKKSEICYDRRDDSSSIEENVDISAFTNLHSMMLHLHHMNVYQILCHRNGIRTVTRLPCWSGEPGDALTFRELKEQTANLTGNLHKMGIKRGDVVSMFSPNHVDFVIATLATTRVGAALSAVNPLYTEQELSRNSSTVRAPKL